MVKLKNMPHGLECLDRLHNLSIAITEVNASLTVTVT